MNTRDETHTKDVSELVICLMFFLWFPWISHEFWCGPVQKGFRKAVVEGEWANTAIPAAVPAPFVGIMKTCLLGPFCCEHDFSHVSPRE